MGTGGSVYAARSFPDYGPDAFHHSPGDVLHNCAVQDYTDRHAGASQCSSDLDVGCQETGFQGNHSARHA